MKSAVPAFDPEAFAERAALIEVNGIPRDWAEGFAKLCVMPFPAAYTPQRWEQIVNDGGLFLDGWGKQAAALGWRAVDVFGVNPDAPELRYDGMGLAVLLEGRRVVAITAHTGRIECGQENFLTYRHCQSLSQSQLLWSLAP